jgi:hypothetical protein
VTVTLTDRLIDPPAPLHARVYVALEVGETFCEPDVDLEPDHAPDAEHDVALELLQERLAD